MDKRSPIWKIFRICEDENKAKCTLCSAVISRGCGSARSFTTTAMNNHMSYRHPDELKLIKNQRLKQTATSAQSTSGSQEVGIQQSVEAQPTLRDFIGKRKKWYQSSPEAQKVHMAIGKMIAVDIQPYSIVDDKGFNDLIGLLEPRYVLPSRKFFSERIIPEMNEMLRGHIQASVSEAKYLCLTTDTWTAHTTTTSFISLTAHWIDETFKCQSAVLHCHKFEGQHTGTRAGNDESVEY